VLLDLRYALRLIRKTPLASAIAILTVAIGVGANSAIFSIIRAVLLKPLPYAHPDRLVQLSESWPGLLGPRPTSRLNYFDWVAQSDVFERIAATSWGSVTIGTAEQPVYVEGSLVSPSYFDVFGLHAGSAGPSLPMTISLATITSSSSAIGSGHRGSAAIARSSDRAYVSTESCTE